MTLNRWLVVGAMLAAALSWIAFTRWYIGDARGKDLGLLAVPFIVLIPLVLCTSYAKQRMIDAELGAIYVLEPSSQDEFFYNWTFAKRTRVFRKDGDIQVAYERVTGVPDGTLWWESIGPARDATRAEKEVLTGLFVNR